MFIHPNTNLIIRLFRIQYKTPIAEACDYFRNTTLEECNKYFITLSRCDIWSHFTHSLYLHMPSTRENMDNTHEITCHISH